MANTEMSNIRMVEEKLPPGFRFHPRDEELVCDYLMKKVSRCDTLLMVEVDLNKCEPWDIPEAASVGGKEKYFYTQRDRKYATGLRTNRATASGYWKATGKDRPILRKGILVGSRKTLVFYRGRAPKGSKTDWVMHEFRLESSLSPPHVSSLKEDWVLCRVFYKNNKDDSVEAKPSMGRSCAYDDTGCSSPSSLPPLTDSYITFDQTQGPKSLHGQIEQVPCFSMFSPNQLNNYSDLSHVSHMDHHPVLPTMDTACVEPFPTCDKKVMEAVLDHLTKMEDNSNGFHVKGSFTSSGSTYVSDVGMPNYWNDEFGV